MGGGLEKCWFRDVDWKKPWSVTGRAKKSLNLLRSNVIFRDTGLFTFCVFGFCVGGVSGIWSTVAAPEFQSG